MLEKIRQLRDSITEEQNAQIEDAAGADIYRLFQSALDSSTEQEVNERIKALTKLVEADPVKVFALYERLTSEQKDLVEELVDV